LSGQKLYRYAADFLLVKSCKTSKNGAAKRKISMTSQLAFDDAFVLASCISRQMVAEGTNMLHYEMHILIKHLADSAGLNPVEKTAVFLARQDVRLGRHRLAAMKICNVLLQRTH